MRKFILGLAFILAGAVNAFAQSTTVSGQITDAGAQSWNNGTYQFQFVPNPQFPTGPYTWTGGTLNKVISGTLNGSGAYSQSVPSNSAISPQGSKWILQVTPNATWSSFSTSGTTITGGTQTLNVTPPAISIDLASSPQGSFTRAYTDAEITTAPLGGQYYNVTSSVIKLCTAVSGSSCTTWVTGGGSGGVCPSGAATDIQVTDGTNCTGSANLIFDSSGSRHLAINAGVATIGQASASADVELFGGSTGNNFLIVTGEGGPNSIHFSALNTPASSMLMESSTNIQSTIGTNFSIFTTQTAGLPGGIYNASETVPYVFQPKSNATNITNFKSPPLALGASTWNGIASPQADGYFWEAVPDTGSNPIVRMRLARAGGTFFATGTPGGTVLDLGVATQGGSLRIVGNTSGSASLGVAAAAGTPNKVNLPTATGTAGQRLITDGGNPQQTSWASGTSSIQFVIDGGGAVPATGVYGQINLPASATITGWTITADQSGSAVVDVLRSTFAAFPTTASIAGTDKPTLSAAQKAQDTTLTGWGSTALNANDEIQINLNSVATVTRINLTIQITVP